MRAASKLALVGVLVVGVVVFALDRSAAAGGLTVTPATLTISLPEGQSEQTAHFTVTNQYDTPIELSFALERPLDEIAKGENPATLVRISNTTVTLAAKQTLRQAVTFTDSAAVQPGSQRVDLVITAVGTSGAQVAVQPSIRMPIILVKQAGAISSITLGGVTGGLLRFAPPQNISASFINDGNMTMIPRGTIQLVAPDGTIVGKGTINTASHAVTPGGELSLDTPITKLANSLLPGFYKLQLNYGLGGGQTDKTTTKTFLYVAWWHLAILVSGVAALLWYRKRFITKIRRATARHLSVKPTFIKRGTA